MNKYLHIVESIILLSILLFQLSTTSVEAQDRTVPGRIVVEFKPGVVSLPSGLLKSTINRSVILSQNVFSACQAVGAIEVEKIFPTAVPGETQIVSPITGKLVNITDLSQYYFLKFPENISVDEAISVFYRLTDVINVHRDTYPILDAIPNDTLFYKQWHLRNTVNSKFDIKATAAWDLAKGDNIKIAIIDGGVRHDHADLNTHIWFGAGSEIGYDTTTFEGRHGTYVAGVAAAVTNNVTGVAGVAWNGIIMPRRGSTVAEFANHIYDAAFNGAKVINLKNSIERVKLE